MPGRDEAPHIFASELIRLDGHEARTLIDGNRMSDKERMLADTRGQLQWEEHLTESIRLTDALSETEKEEVIIARRAQGQFKRFVCAIELVCRVSRVDRLEHLRASHCKPWRDSDNAERLDGENGLLLAPPIDHLFDHGFISFEDRGRLLISPTAHRESLRRMNVPVDWSFNVGLEGEEVNQIIGECHDTAQARAVAGTVRLNSALWTDADYLAGPGAPDHLVPLEVRTSVDEGMVRSTTCRKIG